jgi:hypothetical protein
MVRERREQLIRGPWGAPGPGAHPCDRGTPFYLLIVSSPPPLLLPFGREETPFSKTAVSSPHLANAPP